MVESKKKSFVEKIISKYYLKIYNDSTLEEVVSFRLSRLNVFLIVGSLAFLLVVSIVLLIAYTPIREFIPGYPDGNMRKNIIKNALMVDSLKYELGLKDKYFNNIRRIIAGEEIDNFEALQDTTTKITHKTVVFKKSVQDSILRSQIEEQEQYNLLNPIEKQKQQSSLINFEESPQEQQVYLKPIKKGSY